MEQRVPKAGDHRALRASILALVGAGLVLWAWRYVAEPETVAAPGDRLWDVELGIRAAATAGKTAVEIAAPLNTRHLRIVRQNITHRGWRRSFRLQKKAGASGCRRNPNQAAG